MRRLCASTSSGHRVVRFAARPVLSASPRNKWGLLYREVLRWDSWLRRRIRQCYWKDWKRPRTRRRNLLSLGIPKDEVKMASRSRKGHWRMAANSIVQRALHDAYLKPKAL